MLAQEAVIEENELEEDHVRAFLRLWINEAESPGLLPYAGESVEYISQLMDNQTAILSAATRTPDNVFRANICHMEISRLSYQLSAYHRCRLLKIVRNAYYYSQYQRSLLSPAESAFLDSFRGSFEEELREFALEGFPEVDRMFPDKSMMAGSALAGESIVDPLPEDCRHVIIKMRRDSPQTQIDPDAPHELHDLIPNDIILMQFKAAKKLILDELGECI
jgi:hypothetical protein